MSENLTTSSEKQNLTQIVDDLRDLAIENDNDEIDNDEVDSDQELFDELKNDLNNENEENDDNLEVFETDDNDNLTFPQVKITHDQEHAQEIICKCISDTITFIECKMFNIFKELEQNNTDLNVDLNILNNINKTVYDTICFLHEDIFNKVYNDLIDFTNLDNYAVTTYKKLTQLLGVNAFYILKIVADLTYDLHLSLNRNTFIIDTSQEYVNSVNNEINNKLVNLKIVHTLLNIDPRNPLNIVKITKLPEGQKMFNYKLEYKQK